MYYSMKNKRGRVIGLNIIGDVQTITATLNERGYTEVKCAGFVYKGV